MTRFSSWIISLAVLSAFTICSTYSAPLKGAKASDSKAILDSCIYGVGNNGDTGKAECLKGPGESCESGHRCANGLICRDDLGESSKAVCVVDPTAESSHRRSKRQSIGKPTRPSSNSVNIPSGSSPPNKNPSNKISIPIKSNNKKNLIPIGNSPTQNIPIRKQPQQTVTQIVPSPQYSPIRQQPVNYMPPMVNNPYQNPLMLQLLYKQHLKNYQKKLQYMQAFHKAELMTVQAEQQAQLSNSARNMFAGGLMMPSPSISPLSRYSQPNAFPSLQSPQRFMPMSQYGIKKQAKLDRLKHNMNMNYVKKRLAMAYNARLRAMAKKV